MKKLCVLLLLMVSLFASAKEYTFSPGDVQAMKQLLGSGNLQPGDAVVLKDGTYHNLEEIHFTGRVFLVNRLFGGLRIPERLLFPVS